MPKNAVMGDEVRATFSAKINKRLIKALKMYALEEDKDVYVVTEEAIESYLKMKRKIKDS